MDDRDCVALLQWALPRLELRWPGLRKVRRQVRRRLSRRLEALGLPDAAAYRAYLEAHPDEWAVLDEACAITISRFHRDRGVFALLGQRVLPELAASAAARGEAAVRCWSAGCASGEEPYSLAILWHLDGAGRPGVRLDVLATDRSAAMLARAQAGVYPPGALRDAPPHWRERAFVARDDGALELRPELRAGVRFARHDVRAAPPDGPFDLVLCRHLALTYFAAPLAERVLAGLRAVLAPDGLLVTGKTERLPAAAAAGWAEIAPHSGIYRAAAAPRPG